MVIKALAALKNGGVSDAQVRGWEELSQMRKAMGQALSITGRV